MEAQTPASDEVIEVKTYKSPFNISDLAAKLAKLAKVEQSQVNPIRERSPKHERSSEEDRSSPSHRSRSPTNGLLERVLSSANITRSLSKNIEYFSFP